MTDERAFLKAILEQPDDDSRKLVYADWLEERSDPRAEYLRLMVKGRQDRVVTPEQRQRHQELSAELAMLRTQEMQEFMARLGHSGSAGENQGRQRRIFEVERQLAKLTKQIRQQVPFRLQELAATFDSKWLAVVSDPEIEGCGKLPPKASPPRRQPPAPRRNQLHRVACRITEVKRPSAPGPLHFRLCDFENHNVAPRPRGRLRCSDQS